MPMYICHVSGNTIHAIDVKSNVTVHTFDPTEYLFKLALIHNQYDKVLELIKTSNLVGQSVIAYLQKKGYSEIALHFVKDSKTRFDLAIECGDLEVALETAKKIDNENTWKLLGEEALKQGHHEILEMTYQKIKCYDKLSFLYMLVGNDDKLKKMAKIAEVRGDVDGRYNIGLMLGDIEDQINLLKSVGQVQLAYLTAKTNGLDKIAAAILSESGITHIPVLEESSVFTLPVSHQDNGVAWPLAKKDFKKKIFSSSVTINESHDKVFELTIKSPILEAKINNTTKAWADDEEEDETNGIHSSIVENLDDDMCGGWGDEASPAKLDSPYFENSAPTGFIMPTRGESVQSSWQTSKNVVDLVCSGDFEHAMAVLS